MAVTPGRYRHRVALQARATTKDSAGQQTNTYTTQATAWASVTPIRGREFFSASGEKSNITHRISMRARSDVALKPRDRILFGARIFDVESVLDINERGREWQFMVIEDLHTTDG